MKQLAAFICAFFIGTAFSIAKENNYILWKKVGNWIVAADVSLGKACYTTITFVGGVSIRLGFNSQNSPHPVHLAISSPDWSSIETGKDYNVAWQLDDNPQWGSTASGVDFGTGKGLWSNIDAPNFIEEFVRKHGLKLYFNGNVIASMDLRDSGAAAREMAECQQTVDGYSQQPEQTTPKDPFTKNRPPNAGKDPFAL
jgi:hypothetical protein